MQDKLINLILIGQLKDLLSIEKPLSEVAYKSWLFDYYPVIKIVIGWIPFLVGGNGGRERY